MRVLVIGGSLAGAMLVAILSASAGGATTSREVPRIPPLPANDGAIFCRQRSRDPLPLPLRENKRRIYANPHQRVKRPIRQP